MSLWKRRSVTFKGTDHTAEFTYNVYQARNMASALEFLRQNPVKEEFIYTIVETPEGNIGRDLIYIFWEKTAEPIELASRPKAAKPAPSSGRCAWCGFFVVPAEVPKLPRGVGSVEYYLEPEDIRKIVKTGGGFRCLQCSMLQCGVCTGLTENGGFQEQSPKCLACKGEMQFHSSVPRSRVTR